jgi:hypothetical protein
MDEDDRLRFLFHQAFERGMPTDACPSADELLDVWQHRVPPEERRRIVDHIAGCPVCAEAWRLARGTPVVPPRRGE